MPSDLCLPALAAAVLLWCLVHSLRERGSDGSCAPTWVWREALPRGWSDWSELETISAAADYDAVLRAVREVAHADATAVQFASVVHPTEAPDFTLRVLFVSAVREARRDLHVAGLGT